MSGTMDTILGIDPGSQATGYGIIRSDGNQHFYVASGCIITQGMDLSARLLAILQSIGQIITEYSPDEAAIEQIFMAKNANSALKLGQARGVAIAAMAQQGLNVAEYSPRSIKQSIVGFGAATKQQMQHMIQRLLQLNQAPGADAADALGVAICHAHTRQNRNFL